PRHRPGPHPRVLRSPRLEPPRTGPEVVRALRFRCDPRRVPRAGTDGDPPRRTALPRARVRAGRALRTETARWRSAPGRAHDPHTSVSEEVYPWPMHSPERLS